MKLTIEHDDKKVEVFCRLTDLYIAFRQEEQMMEPGTRKLHKNFKTASFSWGGQLRELVKEVQQSLIELQDFLRGQRNGSPS